MLNGMVTYTCDTGYEVSTGVTTAMATCMASGTWGPLPTCSRMYQIPQTLNCTLCYMINTGVSCGVPPPGTNASPGTPTSTVYQGTMTYTCDTGYQVSNGITTATATCVANRMWEPVPTCSRMLCTVLCALLLMALLYSCGLWGTSTCHQCISWSTNQHNSRRDTPLHLCQWVRGLHWSHHSNGYLYG